MTQEQLTNALQGAFTYVSKGRKAGDVTKKIGGNEDRNNGNGGKKFEKQIHRSVEERVKTNFAKNRNIVIGKKPSSGTMSWGGAPLTIDCYVGRVDFSVTPDQIKSDIEAMGIDVVSLEENVTRHGLFRSFKLVIKKTDFEALNTPEVWPEGVVFRRFRRPRQDTAGHANETKSH